MWTILYEILAPNSLASDSSNSALRSSQNPSGAELWTKTRWKNETLKTASGALFTHFYAIKIQKYFAWWVFGPIPTSGASFTGIGLGDRTWVLRSLIFCLLMFTIHENKDLTWPNPGWFREWLREKEREAPAEGEIKLPPLPRPSAATATEKPSSSKGPSINDFTL